MIVQLAAGLTAAPTECAVCGALIVERWQSIPGTAARCTVPLSWPLRDGETIVCVNGHKGTLNAEA